MPILSLCTGYGGLDMAVEALTGKKVAYVAESDPAASLVLAHHWPDVPNIGDITAYDFTQLSGEVDTITAGFSCQDISNAGPREGISGNRSKIWKDVCRAIRDIRPGHAFLENVAAIRSRGLNVVAEDLASVGYDLWWTTLRASDVGAAHQRLRWFGIAVPHVSDAPGVGRPTRRPESEEQQGYVRRPSGARRELPAHADRQGLAVGRLEPARGQLQAAERSDPATEPRCPTCGCFESFHDSGGFCAGCHGCTDTELGRPDEAPEDSDSAARDERLCAASGQAAWGGARTNP